VDALDIAATKLSIVWRALQRKHFGQAIWR